MKKYTFIFYMLFATLSFGAEYLNLVLVNPEGIGGQPEPNIPGISYIDSDSPWTLGVSSNPATFEGRFITASNPNVIGYKANFYGSVKLDGVEVQTLAGSFDETWDLGDDPIFPYLEFFVDRNTAGKIEIELFAQVFERTNSGSESESNGLRDLGEKSVAGVIYLMDAEFKPNENTHTQIDYVSIIPDDHEEVTVSINNWVNGYNVKYAILDQSKACFFVNNELVNEVTDDDATETLTIQGKSDGDTKLVAYVDGFIIGEITLSIGGKIEIEYKNIVTYHSRDGGLGEPMVGEDTMGGRAIESNHPEARAGIIPQVIESIRQRQPNTESTTVSIILKDKTNRPKKGKRILASSLFNKLTFSYENSNGEPLEEEYVTTDEQGRVFLKISSIPNSLNLYQVGVDRDVVTYHVGRNADTVSEGTQEVDYGEDDVKIENHKNNFSKVDYQKDFEDHGAASHVLPLVSHDQFNVVRQQLEGGKYDSPSDNMVDPSTSLSLNGIEVRVYESGELSNQTYDSHPYPYMFDDPNIVGNDIIPIYEGNSRFKNTDGSDIFEADETSKDKIDFAAIAWEVSLSMAPGYDFIDIMKETLWKPLFKREPTNYIAATIALIGLMADAGYLSGPIGAVGNFVASCAKVIVNRVPAPVIRFVIGSAGKMRDGITYLCNIIIRGKGNGGSFVQRTVDVISNLSRMAETPLRTQIGDPANVSKAVSEIFGKYNRLFSDEAAEGVVRALDQGKDRLVRNIIDDNVDEVSEFTFSTIARFADETADFSDEAIEGLTAVRRNMGEESINAIEEILSETDPLLSNKLYENMKVLDDVDGHAGYINRFSDNADTSIEGAAGNVYESTTAAVIKEDPTTLARGLDPNTPSVETGNLEYLDADKLELDIPEGYENAGDKFVANKIDTFTENCAIQVKHKSNLNEPYKFKDLTSIGTMDAAKEYLDALKLQAEMSGKIPVLQTNVELFPSFAEELKKRNIRWIQTSNGLQ